MVYNTKGDDEKYHSWVNSHVIITDLYRRIILETFAMVRL